MRLAILAGLVLAACTQGSGGAVGGAAPSGPAVCGTPASAETKRMYDGLKAECAGCHMSGTRGYFASLGAFQALLVSDLRLVVPGDPSASELMRLLEGSGTGAFKQMPIAGPTYAARVAAGAPGVEVADVRAWILGLTAQSRDTRPDPLARPITRLSAQQMHRTLYQQLGLTHDDFFVPQGEFSIAMADHRDEAEYPMLGSDELPAPRQRTSAERFVGLGGGSTMRQVKADSSITPTFALTLQQVSQAWCRRALGKTGNKALFPEGTALTGEAPTVKAAIRRWSVHFLAQAMPDAEVDELHTNLFAPLLAEADVHSAYAGLCSYFIRHPAWVFY